MTVAQTGSDVLLSMDKAEKRFHGVQALKGVSISLRKGTVHALCGENGAGKSTLMKILMGVYHADAGDMYLKGEKVEFLSPREALDAGIAIIEQELTPIPDMTIAENIFLGREPMSSCWKDYPEMKWNGGTDANYVVPWTPINATNAAEQWAKRQELTNR